MNVTIKFTPGVTQPGWPACWPLSSSSFMHLLPHVSIEVTLRAWGVRQLMMPVLGLRWSLPLLLSAARSLLGESRFPLKANPPEPKHFCDPAGMWKRDRNTNRIRTLLKRACGGSCCITAGETALLGRWHSSYIAIFHSTLSRLKCSIAAWKKGFLLYSQTFYISLQVSKKLELGRKKENSAWWERTEKNLSLVFELSAVPLAAAALQSCPSARAARRPPNHLSWAGPCRWLWAVQGAGLAGHTRTAHGLGLVCCVSGSGPSSRGRVGVLDQCGHVKIFLFLKRMHSPLLYVSSLRLSSSRWLLCRSHKRESYSALRKKWNAYYVYYAYLFCATTNICVENK